MRQLPDRPNLAQLRRQAREHLRAAQAEAPGVSARDAGLTLAAAQHALARDYGFDSWPKLKAEVLARTTDHSFVIRYVRSPDELRELWHVVWRIMGDPAPRERPHWRVFDRFEEQRRRMLVVEDGTAIVGGTIAMKLIAIEGWARGIGLGRRLLQTEEGETIAAGLPLSTHASEEAKGFYRALGYTERGKSGLHMVKGVPVSPRLVDLRTRRWRSRAGDLDRGVALLRDPHSGTIPALTW